MFKTIVYFLLCLTALSCIQHNDTSTVDLIDKKDSVKVEVNYAKGFEIEYGEGFIKLVTKSFGSNAYFRDSIFFILDSSLTFDTPIKSLNSYTSKIACESSTHLAFLNQLKAIEQVCALCGLNYINDPILSAALVKNKVEEICLTDRVEMEALYTANPDLFTVYPFGNIGQMNYCEKGINTLLIAEYLEESQLARLEWIKLFGVLLGKEKEANTYFNKVVTNYNALKTEKDKLNKQFIMNLPFQEQWFMPSKNSVGVKLITDAGLTYFYENEVGTENILHSKETVWNDGILADYWIIAAARPANFTLSDLLQEEAVYKEFKAVKNGNVIFCNTQTSNYFSEGLIEPDVILKDLLFATKQIQDHNPKYFFLLE